MKVLCKFRGLKYFPFDNLQCDLEFGAWALDGRIQDIVARAADGGVTWVDSPDSDAIAGLTAGSSFQDYTIQDITTHRAVVKYDCCPHSPWPTLIYTVTLSRATFYYVVRMLVPAVVLSLLSFFSFWMEPIIGERLGYGIVCILAIVTNDAYSDTLSPATDELLASDCVILLSKLYALLALLETAVVLYLYHLKSESAAEAFLPAFVRKRFCLDGEDSGPLSLHPELRPGFPTREYVYRRRMWQDMFFVLDKDFSQCVSVTELTRAVEIMLQHYLSGTRSSYNMNDACLSEFIMRARKEATQLVTKVLVDADVDKNGQLSLEEFIQLCEDKFLGLLDEPGEASDNTNTCGTSKSVLSRLEAISETLILGEDRKNVYNQKMWQKRALDVDRFSRWLIPPTYLASLGWFMTQAQSSDEFSRFTEDSVQTAMFWTWGVVTVVVAVLVRFFSPFKSGHDALKRRRQRRDPVSPWEDSTWTESIDRICRVSSSAVSSADAVEGGKQVWTQTEHTTSGRNSEGYADRPVADSPLQSVAGARVVPMHAEDIVSRENSKRIAPAAEF